MRWAAILPEDAIAPVKVSFELEACVTRRWKPLVSCHTQAPVGSPLVKTAGLPWTSPGSEPVLQPAGLAAGGPAEADVARVTAGASATARPVVTMTAPRT